MKRWGRLFVPLTALLLAACSTSMQRPDCIAPALMLEYCLLGPEALQPLVGESRLVTIAGGDESRRDMYFSIGGSPERLVLDASGLFGQPLFTVIQDRTGVSVRPQERFSRPEWLVGLLQLAYVPTDTLRSRLHGIQLDHVVDGKRARRSFHRGERVLLVVEYQPGMEFIHLVERDIEIRIRQPGTVSGTGDGNSHKGEVQ